MTASKTIKKMHRQHSVRMSLRAFARKMASGEGGPAAKRIAHAWWSEKGKAR